MESLNVVFTGQNQVEVRREPLQRLQPDEMLVHTHCTLISTGTECICLERKFAPGTHWDRWVQYPFHAGYSQAGCVIEVGAQVTAFKVGDRVATTGNHQQFIAVPEVLPGTPALLAFPIPDAVSDEEATWGTLAYVTQHGFRKAQIALGEVVVVIGVGLLGQLVAQYARVAGAGEVIAIDTAPQRLAMAAAHGATHTLEMSVQEAESAVADITSGGLADVVFDMTGNATVFTAALKLLRRFGRLILIGDSGTPAEQHLSSEVITRDLQIIGAHAGNSPWSTTDYAPWSKSKMVQTFYKYLERGQMRVSDLITHRFSPLQAAEAYRLLTARRAEAMGVVFDFGSLDS